MSKSEYECQPPDLHSRPKRFYGKYRGVVVVNVDPKKIGRIQAYVPDVADYTLSWAMPCLPLGGNGMGIFAVPPIGAGVWIEFEQGDPDYPIWVGCFWGDSSELPSPASSTLPSISSITLQTVRQNLMVISDKDGIKLEIQSRASISINENGIKIDNGQGASIELTGPSVRINQGALEIK
jgi:uncharacterized protein involved in type VI secretion and phage assembly